MKLTLSLPDVVAERLQTLAAKSNRSIDAIVTEAVGGTSDVEPPHDNPADRVREVQAFFAQFRAQASASDELIAERHLEAWQDTVEDHRASARQSER